MPEPVEPVSLTKAAVPSTSAPAVEPVVLISSATPAAAPAPQDGAAPAPLIPVLHLPQEQKMRAAAILVGTAVLATMGWVGVYLMAFSSDDAAAGVSNSSVPVGLTPGAKVDAPLYDKSGKQISVGAAARAAAAKLPKGNLTQEQKRLALRQYTDAVGLDLSLAASPTTAARSACRLLGTGTEPEDLVRGVAKGGKITRAKSRAFLLGATSIYCPTESKPFLRPPKKH